MIKILLKSYKLNPTTIAFLDGIFISAAINILTGMGSYIDSTKWIALASAITMTVGAILLLVCQNCASKLQDAYKIWIKPIKTRNDTLNDSDHQESSDWITYIKKCNLPFVLYKAKEIITKFEEKDKSSSTNNLKLKQKLKQKYKKWIKHINNINQAIVDEGKKYSTDFSKFVQECKSQKNKLYIEEISDTETLELPHYSIGRLVAYSATCCVSLLVSVGLMIWSLCMI